MNYVSKIPITRYSKREAGLAYVAILLLVAIMSTLGLTFLAKSRILSSATANHADGMQAEYLAEAAANHALWRLLNESDFPADESTYYMHTFQGGRYGYKVRRHTDTTFATVATVGAFGENVDNQSYVLHVKPLTLLCSDLLFVVGDATTLSSKDSDRKALMESWGYNVTLIDDGDTQGNFDIATAAADVVYVSSTIGGGTLADKLTGSPTAIVNEFAGKLDNFGFSSVTSSFQISTGFVSTNSGHYISEPFGGSAVTVFTTAISMPSPAGTVAPDLVAVGSIGITILGILETGAQRWDGAFAPARRAHLPFGGAEVSQLTDDGKTLMKRAIEWAAGCDPCDGLVGYWELDETTGSTVASDSSGNGNNGSLHDMDPANDWVPGQIEGGLDFDGSDDRVDVPYDPSLSLVDGITLAAWIWANPGGLSLYDLVFNKGTTGDNQNYWLGTIDDEITFGWYRSGYFEFNTSGVKLQTESWYHIAATFNNAADEVYVYLNGSEVGFWSTTQEPITNTDGLYIGTSPGGADWNGKMDDLRIYNRVLSPGAISALHMLTEGGCGIAPPVNEAPVVDAGSDQTICPPFLEAQLDGEVTDDGLPDPPAVVTTTWNKVSGPGTVTFDDLLQVDSLATFSEAGEYVLRLRANDGELEDFSEVTITIEPVEENLVNTHTPSAQSAPSVAVAPDGSSVIAWNSWMQDGDLEGVYAQRYDADGTAVGGEFPVNTSTAGSQQNPSVAIDDGGNFVIAWQTQHVYTTTFSIYAQRFDFNGVKQGSEFRVDAFMGADMVNPSVAMAPTGEFVIAFEAQGGFDGNGAGIYARRYDAGGVGQGGGFKVNTYATNDQRFPSVAMDALGNFAVVWDSIGQDGSGSGIYGQLYDGSGVKKGVEFPANTTTALEQVYPDIAMSGAGNFVVVWQGDLGASTEIYFQRFDTLGAMLGGESIVNSTAALLPTVDMNSSGNFVVSWYASDGSGDGVYARGYSAGGSALASEFLVNTTTSNGQTYPDVGIDDNDGFIVAWSGYSPADVNDGVFMGPFCLGVSGGGSGSLIFVVEDASSLSVQDNAKKALMEGWGWTVTPISASATQGEFDTAVASADVSYVSEEIDSNDLGTKLKEKSIGVVNEHPTLHSVFGFSSVRGASIGNPSLNTVSTHYITSPFGGGTVLALFTLDQVVGAAAGTIPSGLEIIGTWANGTLSPLGGLLVLETGATISGGGTAAGRRVQMPWGFGFDANALTADGLTILERSLEWGAASGGGGGASDTDPPTPDPMTWTSPPAPDISTSITMMASTATDVSGVEYYFECTAGGGNDSGWQDSPKYVDIGLAPVTTYTYRVKARDKSSNQNETGWSSEESATTTATPEMFVTDIAMGFRKQGTNYFGQATVWIKDDGGMDVSDALVTGDWSGAVSGGEMGTTGGDGKIFFESPSKKSGGTFTFTVTDVSKSGSVYNPALNVETSDSITAP